MLQKSYKMCPSFLMFCLTYQDSLTEGLQKPFMKLISGQTWNRLVLSGKNFSEHDSIENCQLRATRLVTVTKKSTSHTKKLLWNTVVKTRRKTVQNIVSRLTEFKLETLLFEHFYCLCICFRCRSWWWWHILDEFKFWSQTTICPITKTWPGDELSMWR